MSGWDDAGELVVEGIDWVVDKHYDRAHDGVTRSAHKTSERFRKLRKQPTKYGPNGERLPESQQPKPEYVAVPEQDAKSTSGSVYNQSPRNSNTDQYGQPKNQFSGFEFSEDDRARDLAGQGQIGAEYSPRPGTARSVQAPPQYYPNYNRSRGIDSAMGDSGYGPAQSDYGRNPQASRGYDDGYEGDGADDYRRAYRPERPQPYQQYDPSRYVPHAGVAASQYGGSQAPRDQRYLPPPPAVPRAYDDPYDDEYDSYDSSDERRRHQRRSRSEKGLSRRDSRDSRDSRERSRGGRSERDRGSDNGDGERGHSEKHGPKHKTAATIGGALVGALAGYELSNRRGKPEGFHTIAGAIVGAVGAREADKWFENRKEEKRDHGERGRNDRDEEKNEREDTRYQF